jgi:peptide deformylase
LAVPRGLCYDLRMAVRKLVYYPDDPLTLRAKPVEVFGEKIQRLADEMIETMIANEGVGLAAPQIGLSKRLFVLREPEGEPMIFVNPEIAGMEGQEEGEEGCLSMPGVYAQVPRATQVLVRALNPAGDPFELEAQNFLARVIQHETDHLNGILFPERLDIITRQEKLEEWARRREQLLAEQSAGHAPQ